VESHSRRGPVLIPWETRIALAIPLPPLALAVAISAVLVAIYVSVELALGVPVSRPEILVLLMIGYGFGVNRYIAAAGSGDPRTTDRSVYETEPRLLRHSRWAGLVGVIFALTLGVLAHVAEADQEDVIASLIESHLLMHLVTMPLLAWLMARGAFFTVVEAQHHASETAEAPPVDLMDLEAHYAAGGLALRLALVWIIGASLGALFIVDWGIEFLLPVLLATLALAVAALVIPVQGTRHRVQEAKRAELARLEARIRTLRDAVLAGDTSSQGRLADLLAYRKYVEEVREWPFDSSVFARFGLYLLIPVASWLGGAFVERLVDAALD
jgi:hypothetical protein